MSQYSDTVHLITKLYLEHSATDPDAAGRKRRAYEALGSGSDQARANAQYEMVCDPFYRDMAADFLDGGKHSFSDLERFMEQKSHEGRHEK